MSLRYQPEVDGLRAVAVLAVVAFHAAPRWCRGGFVGVDVFFVISGYLITGIIWSGLESGTFTFASFYERRIRRIVPALAVVLAAVTAVAVVVMLPLDLVALGRSVAATALSGANILFWRQTGYFGPDASTQPLLHAWSLAVEEQFYLAYPVLLVLLHRKLRARALPMLFAAFVLSAVACGVVSALRPGAAFYLAPFRAWELLLGGMLWIAGPLAMSPARREAGAATGLALIGASIAFVSERTTFPMPGALAACLGTALLVAVARSGPSRLTRMLSWRPVVFVGLVSYSLYLWHWPLLAFARYASIPRATGLERATCVAAAFALSVLTWRFVERPARAGMRMRRGSLFAATGIVLGALAAAGAALAISRGLPRRFPQRVEQLAAAARDRDPHRDEYLSDRGHWIDPERAKVFGPGPARTAVFGDSHAAALLPAIAAAAARHGESVEFLGYSGMPPLAGVRVTGGEGALEGERYVEEAMRRLEAPGVTTVVLAARWARYVGGPNDDFGSEAPSERSHGVLAEAGSTVPAADQASLLARALHATVARLRAAGKRVVVVGPIPEFGVDVPRALALIAARGGDPSRFVLPSAVFEARTRPVEDALSALRDPGVLRVEPSALLLRGDGYAAMADGAALYHDDDHLSLRGAALVSPAFDAIFESGQR